MSRSINSVQDTAFWVAVYRARENERVNPLFRDPYARGLAGERGEAMAKETGADRNEWAFAIRTVLFDRYVREAIDEGVDLVLNLAAGLDARPYRMELPAELRWVEVDRADVIDYKSSELASETPRCRLERVPMDLGDVEARRRLFGELAAASERALVVTEGLLIYLSADQVGELARDLAAHSSFRRWAAEVVSPRLMDMMQRSSGRIVAAAGTPFRFAPPEGPDFFRPFGWAPTRIESLFKNAAAAKRLKFPLSLFALLPEPKNPTKGIWSGVCVFEPVGRDA